MPTKRLTDRTVKSLKTKLTQEDYWDSSFKLRGISFGVRVTKDNAREYVVRYRDLQGRRRRMSVGDANHKSLAEGHKLARDVFAKLDSGIDPAQELEEYKSADSFSELCDLYLRLHAIPNKKDKGKADKRVIEQDLKPAWGGLKACDVTRKDVLRLLDHVAIERKAPVMANRTRALISKIFNFALEREIVTASPCSGMPRKYKESAKDRHLDDTEIPLLFTELKKESFQLSCVFQFILLTGQRPSEVAGARWGEFDDNFWTIPKERVKNGRTHKIPLTPQISKLLDQLRASAEEHHSRNELKPSDYVFWSNRNEYVRPNTINHCAERLYDRMKVSRFTAHDLRRTAATGLRRIKVSREIVAKILNHTPQDVTAQHYDRYAGWDEMRKALTSWGNSVARICNAESNANVISFGGRQTSSLRRIENS